MTYARLYDKIGVTPHVEMCKEQQLGTKLNMTASGNSRMEGNTQQVIVGSRVGMIVSGDNHGEISVDMAVGTVGHGGQVTGIVIGALGGEVGVLDAYAGETLVATFGKAFAVVQASGERMPELRNAAPAHLVQLAIIVSELFTIAESGIPIPPLMFVRLAELLPADAYRAALKVAGNARTMAWVVEGVRSGVLESYTQE